MHIDEPLMQELANVKEIAKPDEILLVVDSLTGQDIVNVVASFNEKLSITGAVLTKLDGDSRGGEHFLLDILRMFQLNLLVQVKN